MSLSRHPLLAGSALLHLVALPTLWLAPALWPWVLAIVALDHVALVWGSLWPRSALLGPNLRRLPPERSSGRVALSFDDGPDPEVTPEVLRILADHGARATFFCIGARAERHPALVREIVGAGHTVANHTQHHPNLFSFYLPRAMAREIDACQAALERTADARPRLFRAPAGIRNPWLEPLLARRGMRLVSWTRRGFDAVSTSPDRVLRRLTDGLAAGDLLLLHDGNAARDDAGRPVVLELLPSLLEELRRRELVAVALDAESADG